MIAKLLDRKMLILLGVILAAAAAYIYLSTEGFAQNANYLQYMKEKYGTNTLCDPCYDPNCKTLYPVNQSDCSPSGSIPAPTYNPNDFSGYTYSTGNASTSPPPPSASAPAGIPQPLYDQLKSEMMALFSKRQPDSDILISFAPTGSDAMPNPANSWAAASTGQVIAGATGKLPMDTLPNPALAPASAQASSPAISQGADYNQGTPVNMNDYIRKDSIPCYSCNLR
jgi:hypothetical protein